MMKVTISCFPKIQNRCRAYNYRNAFERHRPICWISELETPKREATEAAPIRNEWPRIWDPSIPVNLTVFLKTALNWYWVSGHPLKWQKIRPPKGWRTAEKSCRAWTGHRDLSSDCTRRIHWGGTPLIVFCMPEYNKNWCRIGGLIRLAEMNIRLRKNGFLNAIARVECKFPNTH